MKKLLGLALLSGLVFGVSSNALAQTGRTPDDSEPMRQQRQEGRMHGEHGKRGGRHFGKAMMRGLHKLDLNDAQKQQIQTIMQNDRTANESLRQEMMTLREGARSNTLTADQKTRFQTLREQMKQNQDQVHAQILAILTPEQREKLDQMKKEEKHERFNRHKDGEKPNQTNPQN